VPPGLPSRAGCFPKDLQTWMNSGPNSATATLEK